MKVLNSKQQICAFLSIIKRCLLWIYRYLYVFSYICESIRYWEHLLHYIINVWKKIKNVDIFLYFSVVIKEDKEANKKSKSKGEEEDDDEGDKTVMHEKAGDESSDSEIEDEEDAKQSNKFQQAHDDQEPEVDEMEQSDGKTDFEF